MTVVPQVRHGHLLAGISTALLTHSLLSCLSLLFYRPICFATVTMLICSFSPPPPPLIAVIYMHWIMPTKGLCTLQWLDLLQHLIRQRQRFARRCYCCCKVLTRSMIIVYPLPACATICSYAYMFILHAFKYIVHISFRKKNSIYTSPLYMLQPSTAAQNGPYPRCDPSHAAWLRDWGRRAWAQTFWCGVKEILNNF